MTTKWNAFVFNSQSGGCTCANNCVVPHQCRLHNDIWQYKANTDISQSSSQPTHILARGILNWHRGQVQGLTLPSHKMNVLGV